jgi:hypothetical protein
MEFVKPAGSTLVPNENQKVQQQQQLNSNKKSITNFHSNTNNCSNQITSSNHNTILIQNPNILEAFALLLDWLSQVHLKNQINFNLPLNDNSQILEKSYRLLPLLAELIIYLNSFHNSSQIANANTSNQQLNFTFKKYHLAFLEFIYWSLLHCDTSIQNQVTIFF